MPATGQSFHGDPKNEIPSVFTAIRTGCTASEIDGLEGKIQNKPRVLHGRPFLEKKLSSGLAKNVLWVVCIAAASESVLRSASSSSSGNWSGLGGTWPQLFQMQIPDVEEASLKLKIGTRSIPILSPMAL